MKKSNIGIITYHNAINYGAILQTYALNKYINSLGRECETIDYTCEKINNSYKLINLKSLKSFVNSVLNLKNNIIRRKKFGDFSKNNIKLSNKKYNRYNITEANGVYDKFITGSDQVWNLELNEDYNYYLEFVSDNNSKYSYAASFGNIDVLRKNSLKVKNLLEKFNIITVREKTTINDIKKECNLNSEHVLDPTFLLSREEWEKVDNHKKYKEKYILLYVLHEESAYYIAEKLSKLTGLKVYIITESRRQRIKGKYIRTSGPRDFISLIKNSEYVVTDSFHGTALSIILQKNLKVVLKTKMKYFNERLISIINTLFLDECIVNLQTSNEELLNKVNYEKVQVLLDKKIKESKKIIDAIVK